MGLRLVGWGLGAATALRTGPPTGWRRPTYRRTKPLGQIGGAYSYTYLPTGPTYAHPSPAAPHLPTPCLRHAACRGRAPPTYPTGPRPRQAARLRQAPVGRAHPPSYPTGARPPPPAADRWGKSGARMPTHLPTPTLPTGPYGLAGRLRRPARPPYLPTPLPSNRPLGQIRGAYAYLPSYPTDRTLRARRPTSSASSPSLPTYPPYPTPLPTYRPYPTGSQAGSAGQLALPTHLPPTDRALRRRSVRILRVRGRRRR